MSLARAADPFLITATTVGPGSFTVSAGGVVFKDVTQGLVESQGQFQALAGHAFNANLDFLGVPNAMTFVENAAGTSATLGLTPINFTKTFTGTSPSDLNSQIKDFLKSDGQGVLSAFLAAIAASSKVAITDGNPKSATALDANSIFLAQAFTPSDQLTSQADASSEEAAKPKFSGFAIGLDSGSFKAGDFSGNYTDLSYSKTVFRVVAVSGYLDYLTVGGAKVYGGGLDLSVPIRLSTMDATHAFNWRVTPVAGASARVSTDLAGGVALWDAGVLNTVDYRVNRRLIVCLMDAFTAYRNISVHAGGYSVDPRVSQEIMKNGLRAVAPLTRRLVGDFFVVETNFLGTASIKQFTTFGTSVSLRAARTWNLTLGANYDTGSSYQSWSVGLNSAWRW